MKNIFSLVSTYISWSSLSRPTPRMRKASDSCLVSAAHPLVTQSSCRLFRLCSCRYVTKGVVIIVPPPLPGDRRYLRGGAFIPEVRCVQRWDSSVSQCRRSELDTQHTLLLVVKINISAYDLSQLQKHRRDSGCASYFNDNMPAAVREMCMLTTLDSSGPNNCWELWAAFPAGPKKFCSLQQFDLLHG